MEILKYISATALLPLCLFVGTAHALDGSYTSGDMKRMDVHSANILNQFTFPISPGVTPPANTKVNIIYWNYGLGRLQVGNKGALTVYLCQGNTSTCINISDMQSGSTTAFKYKSATIPFFLYYRVDSKSIIGTIYGSGPTQLTVNWTDRW
ncbi:flagellar protein FlhE [Pectobacterium aroidearum]|uniref:flagellar protein FlhE n=1 Tax=Pectobacterium aroidearum TaxID=1201031 RepID=UPI0021151F06|nr:flagellar protein FlhE [Pectobacterium aroidearum]UUE36915.1 flagellar protein FlhE [Pectobacterium aroidearum]UUE41293.1 flagellar protein FlhE [Pectobacterium aroidearum]